MKRRARCIARRPRARRPGQPDSCTRRRVSAMSRGVFVLGMHRSGTSAATRLVNLLGVPTCADEDLLPATDDNPRGYWESASLTAFNDRIFAAFESDWSCPPGLDPGWEKDPALAELRAEATTLFSRVFPAEQWVWKDPRNCITFPFWASCPRRRASRRAGAPKPARDRRVARCTRRPGKGLLPRALGAVLRGPACLPYRDCPTLVTTYDEILDDPATWCEGVRDVPRRGGVATTTRELAPSALDFVDTELRHTHLTRQDLVGDPAVSSAQRELFDVLEGLRGAHDALSVPRPPGRDAHDRGAPRRAAAPVPARARVPGARRVLPHARRAVRRAAAPLVRSSEHNSWSFRRTRKASGRSSGSCSGTPTISVSASSRSRRTRGSSRPARRAAEQRTRGTRRCSPLRDSQRLELETLLGRLAATRDAAAGCCAEEPRSRAHRRDRPSRAPRR